MNPLPYPLQDHHDIVHTVGEGHRIEGWNSITFHPVAFFEQFLIQLFQPFSIPLVLLLRGKNAVWNMKLMFVSFTNPLVFFFTMVQLLFSTAVFLIVLIWIIIRIRNDDEILLFKEAAAFMRSVDYEIAIISFNMIFHRGVIALKYAFLSTTDYENIMTNIETDENLNDDQLLSAWTNLNGRVIMKELRLAAARLGIQADTIRIDMNNQQYKELISSMAPCALSYLTETGQIREELRGMNIPNHHDKSSSSSRTTTDMDPTNNNNNNVITSKDSFFTKILKRIPTSQVMPYADSSDIIQPTFEVPSKINNNKDTEENIDGSPTESVASPIATSPVHIHHHERLTHPPVMPLASQNSVDASGLSFLQSPSLHEKRTMSISVLALCAATLSHVNNITVPRLRYLMSLSFIVAAVIALLPLIIRSWFGIPVVGTSTISQVIVILCIFMNIWFLSLLLFYLQTGVLDYRRRRLALQHLGSLGMRRYRSKDVEEFQYHHQYNHKDNNIPTDSSAIAIYTSPIESSTSPGNLKDTNGIASMVPKNDKQSTTTVLREFQKSTRRSSISMRTILDPNYHKQNNSSSSLVSPVVSLDSVTNIRAWLTARQLLRGAGARFTLRITIIASISLLFSVVTTIIVISKLLLGSDTKYNDVEQAGIGDLIMAIDVIALLTVVGTYLFIMLVDGAKTNTDRVRQCSLLIGRQSEALTAQSLYETKASQLRIKLLHINNDDPDRLNILNDIEQYTFASQQWNHTANMLGIAKATLQYDEPITLLGINCSLTFAQTIAYGIITGQGIVMKLINDKYGFVALPSWLTK